MEQEGDADRPHTRLIQANWREVWPHYHGFLTGWFSSDLRRDKLGQSLLAVFDAMGQLVEDADVAELKEKYTQQLCEALIVYLQRQGRDPLADTTGETPTTALHPTKLKILSLCRKKALPATAIARKLELSPEHTRRVLAQLMRDHRLKNGPEGYRTVRAT